MKLNKILPVPVLIFVFMLSVNAESQQTCQDQDIDKLKGDVTFGVIIAGSNPEKEFKELNGLGFAHCQLNVAKYSPELAQRIRSSSKNYQVSTTTLICMGPGKYAWNFIEGPSTIGLIPREFRVERIKRLHEGIDFCKEAGIPAVHAHFGFIPENPKDSLYIEFIQIMKELGNYALNKGVDIYFETGQETPVTLLRAITDIGTGNLYVNCDLANLVMYGKSNSLDGVKILHRYIREFHAKDGLYPTNPYELGKEVPIPEGAVNFPEIVRYLKDINFKGTITIENELTEKNYGYLEKTKNYLEGLFMAGN